MSEQVQDREESEMKSAKISARLLPRRWCPQQRSFLHDYELAERPLRPKLIILDINGLLLHREFRDKASQVKEPDAQVGSFYVWERPGAREFLQFCRENFAVGIWSSAQWKNVNGLLMYIMPDERDRDLLAFQWDQKMCTNTGESHPENSRKPVFLKELTRVWNQEQMKGVYDDTNTLLIDDSPYKARENPPFTAIHPQAWIPDDERPILTTVLTEYLSDLCEAQSIPEFVRENPYKDDME